MESDQQSFVCIWSLLYSDDMLANKMLIIGGREIASKLHTFLV